MHFSAIIIFSLVAVASATAGFQRVNNSTAKAASTNKVTAKSARSDYPHHGYEHHYPHHFGGGHLGFGHHKEFDHYLLPMLVLLGLGVLFMPLLSVLMTTMVGNVPVTTLVSGRKRREVPLKPVSDQTIMDLWQRVSKAIEAFTKEYK